jgi:PAS domain S-box-containing protein
MLGYAPEDLIGRLGQELSPPEDSEADAATYAELRSAGPRVFVREKRYLRRDGSTVWGRLSATIVRNRGQGRPDLLIGVIENIEEQHRAREALRITTADLERTIEERTAALAQRDLLLREVYHRVKNNLQMVDALLHMQARDVADPEAKTALRGLRSRIFALGLVHHQLMGSSNLQTFDVAPFLQELSANLADGAGARGIEMRVHADPLQVGLDFAIPLGLLVTELLTNAIKHAFPDGIGEIDVSLSLADDDWIDLVVADNGKGFKPQAAGDETGLGGRIMRGLLGQMRGTMTVGNGRGARCEIRLPAPEVR